MVLRPNSAWSLRTIENFLEEQRIPLRLACATPGAGPVVCSLWYVYDDGALWCATQKSARVTGYLAQQPACGFEIAPEAMPYRGVRGQGIATLSQERGLHVLERLIDRYVGDRGSEFARWLLRRAHNEVAIRIDPNWLTSWDFSQRMNMR